MAVTVRGSRSSRAAPAAAATSAGTTTSHGTPIGTLCAPWWERLATQRRTLPITQQELAARVGVSMHAIRAYERGARKPDAETLYSILVALGTARIEVRSILSDAGYAPARILFPESLIPGYYFTVEEAKIAIEAVPWPKFVVNNAQEIVAANHAARTLWDVDFEAEYGARSRRQLSFLTIMVEPRFRRHLANFAECVSAAIASFKSEPGRAFDLEGTDPNGRDAHLGALVAQVMENSPADLPVLFDAWQRTEPLGPYAQATYRIVWADDAAGEIELIGVISVCNEQEAIVFNDWHPANAESHARLERLIASRADRHPPEPRPPLNLLPNGVAGNAGAASEPGLPA